MNAGFAELPFDPFAARAVGDPWRSPEPDIASINATPFQGILKLLAQVHKTQQVAALVLGEAGSGKTHLIKRLMSGQDLNLIFVYVHPMKDYRSMFNSLLERVLTNLDYVPLGSHESGTLTQLDHIVANVIVAALKDYAQQHPDKVPPGTLKTIKKDPWKVVQFKKKEPTWVKILKKSKQFLATKLSKDHISEMVLKCLFQYLDESKRSAVRTFLRGYVPDEEDATMLGLKFSEIDLTVEAQEMRSKQILKTVGRLLGFYRPMILCFDQLENLDTPALVNSFGRMISEIVNEIDNILPVGFMRPDTLESSFSQGQCDKAALDRLTSKVFGLEGCNLDQALDMVKARLAWAFEGSSDPPPHPFHPFREDLLRKEILKDGNSPRLILTKASKLLGGSFTTEDPLQIVRQCFSSEREKLLAGGKEPFAKQTVLDAVSLYFEHRPDSVPYLVSPIQRGGGVDLHLQVTLKHAEAQSRRLDLQVETSTNGPALIKSLGNLIRRIQGRETDLSVFVRDASSPIPPGLGKMPKTVEKLQGFEIAGGLKRYLEYNHLVDLFALVYTRNKIPSGDLSYVANPRGGRRPVEMESLSTFVKDHFSSRFLEDLADSVLTGQGAEQKLQPELGSEEEKKVVSLVIKILKKPPFKFKLEQIAQCLEKQSSGLAISLDQLTVIISRHSQSIVQIAVTPPIYYLKKG